MPHIGMGRSPNHQVAKAARGGAEFAVSPTLDAEVVCRTKALGLSSVPGVLTPSEAVRATSLGADFVKLFPASAWSPRSWPMSLLRCRLWLLSPRAVSISTRRQSGLAGAVAVGIGGALTSGAPGDVPSRVARLLARLGQAGAHCPG